MSVSDGLLTVSIGHTVWFPGANGIDADEWMVVRWDGAEHAVLRPIELPADEEGGPHLSDDEIVVLASTLPGLRAVWLARHKPMPSRGHSLGDRQVVEFFRRVGALPAEHTSPLLMPMENDISFVGPGVVLRVPLNGDPSYPYELAPVEQIPPLSDVTPGVDTAGHE